jgi:hypothetical protein
MRGHGLCLGYQQIPQYARKQGLRLSTISFFLHIKHTLHHVTFDHTTTVIDHDSTVLDIIVFNIHQLIFQIIQHT